MAASSVTNPRRLGSASAAFVLAVAVTSQASAQTLGEPANQLLVRQVPNVTIHEGAITSSPQSAESRFAFSDDGFRPRGWRLNASGEPVWTTEMSSTVETSNAVPTSLRQVSHRPPARQSRSSSVAKKIAAGAALGLAGFYAGGVIGAALEGDCSCDDPGLLGAVIGAPIGAAIGATVGVLLVR